MYAVECGFINANLYNVFHSLIGLTVMFELLLQLWEGNMQLLEELTNGGTFMQDLLSGCQRLKLQVFASWLILIWLFMSYFPFQSSVNVFNANCFPCHLPFSVHINLHGKHMQS